VGFLTNDRREAMLSPSPSPSPSPSVREMCVSERSAANDILLPRRAPPETDCEGEDEEEDEDPGRLIEISCKEADACFYSGYSPPESKLRALVFHQKKWRPAGVAANAAGK